MEEDVSALQQSQEGMEEYLDHEQILENALTDDKPRAPSVEPMSDY